MLILLDDFAGDVDVALRFEGVRFGPRLLVVVNGVSVSEHPGALREVIPVVMRIDDASVYLLWRVPITEVYSDRCTSGLQMPEWHVPGCGLAVQSAIYQRRPYAVVDPSGGAPGACPPTAVMQFFGKICQICMSVPPP